MKISVVAFAVVAAMAAGPAAAGISIPAQRALARAQRAVTRAEAHHNMWTVTGAALKQAKAAARKGDSAAVIRYATRATEFARLSIEQTHLPLVKSGGRGR